MNKPILRSWIAEDWKGVRPAGQPSYRARRRLQRDVERDGMHVLRSADNGLLHIPKEGSNWPWCGHVGVLLDVIHPVDRGAFWCRKCLDAICEAYPRKERDLRG